MPKGVPITTYEKVCPICKKSFITKYKKQKWCSQICYHKKPKKYHPKPKPILEGTCLWCHTKFIKKRNQWQKFCDIDCRDAYNRLKEAIERKYPFEYDRYHLELDKLAVLGQNYGKGE
jgi:hypothetical protein